jgi:diguanylate cyclase (GGDEF)-like protein
MPTITVDTASRALDMPTLLFVSTCLTALLGLFLLIAWLHERDMRALAWWGAAYLIGSSSIGLWSSPGSSLPLPIPADVPGALIFVACGMVWSGVRLFHGRVVRPFESFAGGLVWLFAYEFIETPTARIALSAMIVATYAFLTGFELARERRKSMHSRIAAILVPGLHAAIFLLPIALKPLFPASASAFSSDWFRVFALDTMMYAVGTAFIVVMLVKDYHVHFHRNAASTDGLTGLLNRRAFLDAARSLCARAEKKNEPVTVLMFDLDHFKSINDRFGHATGDDALRLFATTARSRMRANDIIGRLGGEEFAAIVTGDLETAAKIAERVRGGFEQVGVEISGHTMNATVSIGAACSIQSVEDVQVLLARADAALYRAKAGGRNRMCAAGDEVPETAARLIAAARAANAHAGAGAETRPTAA